MITKLIAALIFLGTIFTSANPAFAETVEVAGVGLADVYTKDVETGKKVALKVFLKSCGDPLDGYTIQLFKTSGHAPVLLTEKKSDASGILTFNGVIPSKYLVVLKRGEKSLLSVQLGDLRIMKEGL